MRSSTSNFRVLHNFLNRRTLVAFVITISLLVVVGFFFRTNDDDIIPLDFFARKAHAKAVYDVVLIGDSRTYRGLSPYHMQKLLKDHDILNFGFSSGGLGSPLLEAAQSKLDSDDDVKNIIVIGFTPYSFTPQALKNEHYIESVNMPYNAFQFQLASITQPIAVFFQPIDVDKIFEVLHPDEKANWTYQQKWDKYGWVASDRVPHQPDFAVSDYKKAFQDNQVDEKAVVNLMAQIEEWTNEGICVIGFQPPTSPEILKLEEKLSGYQKDMVVQLFIQDGGLWLDLDPGEYQSYDGSHVTEDSAIKLSLEVAQFIVESGCLAQ